MKNKLIIIVFAIFLCNILFSINNIFSNTIPVVEISRPNPQVVYNGGSVEYIVTFHNTSEVNFTAKDVGKAGDNVTLNKEVIKIGEDSYKHIYKVVLKNINGPKDKMVSIAIRKGIAKNAVGTNEQSYKSYAFKILEKEQQEVVVPKPEPKPVIPQPKPNVNPVKPQEKVDVKKPTKLVNIVNEKPKKIEDITITEATNVIIEEGNQIGIKLLYLDKVSEGDTIKYILELKEDIKNYNLTSSKIDTVGFTADILIRNHDNKKIIILSNIKGECGKDKNIIIKEDIENQIKEIRNTQSFEIVEKKPVDKTDIIKIPFTGII